MLLLLQVATKNVHQSALKSSARHGDTQRDSDGYRELEREVCENWIETDGWDGRPKWRWLSAVAGS